MSLKQAGERYAATLLSLAKERNVEDKVRGDMDVLRDAFDVKELIEAVKSPIIEGDKKKNLLKAVFEGKVESITLDFLNLMIDKGRDKAMIDAMQSYIGLYNAHKNIKRVNITTASELEESDLESLKNKVKEKYFKDCELEIVHSVDASLIGGFVMEFDDQLLDASLKNSLKRLAVKYSN